MSRSGSPAALVSTPLRHSCSAWEQASQPAYDLNPVASGDGLTLHISETDNDQKLSLLRQVAKHFPVKAKRAEQIIAEVVATVRGWPAEASAVGLARTEQERMAEAFRVAMAG